MTSEIRFIASTVNCYTENDVLIIGIGNDPVAPGNYLIISRFDDGDADNSIGIQTHLSEIEISNVIKSVILNKKHLTILIKNSKVDKTHFQSITIEFQNNNFDYELLRGYINEIFRRSSVEIRIGL